MSEFITFDLIWDPESLRNFDPFKEHEEQPIKEEKTMTRDEIRLCYEDFKVEWMSNHGYTIENLIESLGKYMEETGEGLKESFEMWENECGFKGGIWPCFEEWLAYEGSEYAKAYERITTKGFDWSKLTETDFAEHCAKIEQGIYDPDYKLDAYGMLDGQYVGCVHMGELAFDVVVREYEGKYCLDYDLYVLGVDDGYGYTVNGEPYTECGGGSFDGTMIHLTYDQFKEEAEATFQNYIEKTGSCRGLSLAEVASKPTKIW